jgi:hypothetical protein
MQLRPCIKTASLWGLLLCFACSTGQDAITKIDESPLGAVFLHRIAGGPPFQAAHPIKIDSSTITLVLNGILVRDNPPVQKNSSESSNVRRLFSGSEVGHVAPIVSEGLRRATPDQEVEFRIGEVTGVLYAYGRSLYVTLTEDRSGLDAATTTGMAKRTPDGTGFADRTVSFIPEAAQRGNSYRDARSTDTTLVIDYELLAMLPPASLPSARNAPTLPPQSGNADKDDPGKRDAEIEALRKELQDIKKQLAEQEAERTRSQRTNPVPQK